MVKTRLTTLFSVTAAGLLLATVSVASAVSAVSAASPAGAAGPEEEAPSAKVDLSKRPFVIFSPVPPKPEAVRDYPTPDGAADYWQLWEPGAPWQDAASKIDLFAIHSWMVRHYFTDDELKLMFDWLDEHDIPLGLEMEPLEWPGPEVCDHGESFEGPYDMEMAQRIKDLGGTVGVVSLDEPFVNAHLRTGPRTCGFTVEQVVDEVTAYRGALRRLFPDVAFGSIEAVLTDPYTTADDLAIWLDTFEERSGEPFDFLNIDVDWRREGWQESVRAIEEMADQRGVPFGMLYLGSEFAQDSDTWLRQNAQHMASYEQGYGGTPDVVGIYSWHERPDRLLPDDDPGAFTSLVNRYFGARTALQDPTVGGGGRAVRGRLTTTAGEGLAGREIEISAYPLDGTPQRHSLGGTVPAGARTAIIGMRTNTEGGTPSRADVGIARVSYEEKGDGVNRVPNPGFRKGLESWAPYGEGSAKVRGGTLRLTGAPRQAIFVDGEAFKVTPGAEYELAAVLDVPEASFDSGFVAVMFIADEEVERQSIWFRPKPVVLPPVTTDESGGYRVPTAGLDPGRYDVSVDYPGDVDHWAAQADVRLKLR